jgi:hypothetical protein
LKSQEQIAELVPALEPVAASATPAIEPTPIAASVQASDERSASAPREPAQALTLETAPGAPTPDIDDLPSAELVPIDDDELSVELLVAAEPIAPRPRRTTPPPPPQNVNGQRPSALPASIPVAAPHAPSLPPPVPAAAIGGKRPASLPPPIPPPRKP